MNVGYVCPTDVKKMIVQQARSIYWKKWAVKHEYEELKEGWNLLLPCVDRRRTKSGLKNIEMLPENWFWKEAGCRGNSSTSGGQMKVNVKPVFRRKAQKKHRPYHCPE